MTSTPWSRHMLAEWIKTQNSPFYFWKDGKAKGEYVLAKSSAPVEHAWGNTPVTLVSLWTANGILAQRIGSGKTSSLVTPQLNQDNKASTLTEI